MRVRTAAATDSGPAWQTAYMPLACSALTARGNRWAMRDQDGTVLVIAAFQGLLRSSAQISIA